MNLNLDEIKGERCKRSFYYFFKEFWSEISTENLVDNWHIKYLCDELQLVGERIARREPKLYDLIINVPPASTKSSIASVAFPAWLWTIDPTIRVISGSHGQSLSLSLAVKSRDIIQSERYKRYFPYIQLKQDSNNKSDYGNTKNGQRIATSVGSGIIGQHAHIQIVDDPLNLDPSLSEVATANNWMDSLSTRKVDKEITPLILIMQRLADNDVTAYMLKKAKKVKHICLPAEQTNNINPPELKSNYTDGLFDTLRISRDVIESTRVDMGSYKYESQFLQNPSPQEGGIIKHHWIKFIREVEITNDDEIDFFVDTALTANTNNDPSGIIATIYKKQLNQLYVYKAVECWLEFNELVKLIDDMAKQFGNVRSKVYIEPKANGHSVVQYLQKNSSINVVLDKAPDKDKDTRLVAVSPFIEAGKVYFITEGEQLPKWGKLNFTNVDELSTEITSVKPSKYGLRDTLIMAIDNKLNKRKSGKYSIR